MVYRNHKLAVVEAKAWDQPITGGLGQAKDYAGRLSAHYAYSSNGQGIYGVDMVEGTEGDVAKYLTPDELWNLTFAQANAWRNRFSAIPFSWLINRSGASQINSTPLSTSAANENADVPHEQLWIWAPTFPSVDTVNREKGFGP